MTESSTSRGSSDAPVPVPDLWVEKLALGELSSAEAQAVRTRLGDAAEGRLAALARSDEELLREHPPAQVAADVQRRLARLEDAKDRTSGGGFMVWAPMAAAAAVALVWWVGRGEPTDPGGGETDPVVIAEAESSAIPAPKLPPSADGAEQITLKGDPVLMIDRVQDRRPQRMASDAAVAAGDLLQITYNAKGAAQGVILSLDGAGVTTLHYPETEAGSPALDHGGPIPLRQSYELDDAPSFERFVFVTVDATEPTLDVARVMDAARELASDGRARDGELSLPEGTHQRSILLLK